MIASENNDWILKNIRTNRWIRWMRAHFGEETKMQNASIIGNFASYKLIPSEIHSINQLQCGWSLCIIPATSRPLRELLLSAILMSFNQLSIQLTTYWLRLNCVCTCIVACLIGLIEWQTILSHYWSKFICLSSELINMRRCQRKFTVIITKHVVFLLVWIIFIFVHSFVLTDYRQF